MFTHVVVFSEVVNACTPKLVTQSSVNSTNWRVVMAASMHRSLKMHGGASNTPSARHVDATHSHVWVVIPKPQNGSGNWDLLYFEPPLVILPVVTASAATCDDGCYHLRKGFMIAVKS
eukprot:3410720-Amphidinium_carterae.1